MKTESKTRAAARIAYRMARFYDEVDPWEFRDMESSAPDYLRTWTRWLLTDYRQTMADDLRSYEGYNDRMLTSIIREIESL